MIDNELWDKLDMFVGTNLLSTAIPHFINEFQERLTPEQLAPLGDLNEMLTNTFSVKTDRSAKEVINGYIHLAKLGVIIKKR
ncbi:hypothetical protein OIU83_17630 [Flavobacterium sp. LS1R49]|uniref:Uncharacterized protein n=1 Tax=Flavobacterium shii TaxID=2987687 RepID=A0A9X3BZL0_9FLAO|nr:hypothetical protein [Flavobacterium shii]MCV9929486.1 hypothetical protein [Flavobacterium shii]